MTSENSADTKTLENIWYWLASCDIHGDIEKTYSLHCYIVVFPSKNAWNELKDLLNALNDVAMKAPKPTYPLVYVAKQVLIYDNAQLWLYR